MDGIWVVCVICVFVCVCVCVVAWRENGKLYCSDNALDPSTAQPTVWSLS